MRTRPPIEQIRRAVLAALVVVVFVIAGSYGVRRWRAHQAHRAVPGAIPGDVQQQTEKFSFSRSEEGRTLFTVQASRTVEREGKTTILEDVVVKIYGHGGDRADEIRTARCNYDMGKTGTILCPTEVKVHLGRGQTPAGVAADGSLELTTTALRFDPATGVAWTDQFVQFSFPAGAGEAVGLRYQPSEPRMRLEEGVAIHVTRGDGAPVQIRAAELEYYASTQALELAPPLVVGMSDRTLVADHLRMLLDENFRTQRLEATGNVRARGEQDGRRLTMRAARAAAIYADDGRIRQVRASGQVRYQGQGGNSREELTCQEAVFDFDPTHRWLKRVVASGEAYLVSKTAEETRELHAPVLELTLAPGRDRQLLAARERGTLVLRRPGGEQRTVAGERIELEFEARQYLRGLQASGAVETKASRPGRPDRLTWSDELQAGFDGEGNLTEAEQWGHFRYQGGEWRAEAGRAQYHAATGTVFLRQQPVVWDPSSRTSARMIEVEEKTGTMRAVGEVRTLRQAAADETPGFGTRHPVHVAADRMQTDRKRGWARYEGRARLWQGENRLAAQALELFRQPSRLVAEGNVSGLFLETAQKENGAQKARRRAVRVTSERFTYVEEEHRGLFEGSVTAQNDFGTLTAPKLEVFLAGEEGAEGQRLERARARGGVLIEQASRRAKGEEAEYRAKTQTVVLRGGTPTVTDPQRGTTTGARLTLFLADDTILVDSGKGERAVTRRPWTR